MVAGISFNTDLTPSKYVVSERFLNLIVDLYLNVWHSVKRSFQMEMLDRHNNQSDV